MITKQGKATQNLVILFQLSRKDNALDSKFKYILFVLSQILSTIIDGISYWQFFSHHKNGPRIT